jgi:hypothetical protein
MTKWSKKEERLYEDLLRYDDSDFDYGEEEGEEE